jgi:2'-5' RNA ligase
VLVADLAAADDGLALLHADLERALAGWHAPETRSFRPHVTVARVRRGERLSQREVAAPPELTFSPTALVLYRSELGGPTPSYEAVGRARLR